MERASEDSKKSLLKYDFSIGILRFFILLSILSIPYFRQQQIYSAAKQVHWEIPDTQWDKRRLRNRGPYLVEGKGGMQVLLGESEVDVRKVIGESTRRSFSEIDKLFIERRTYRGEIWLKKGFVVRLVYFVKKQKSFSLEWNSALGLRQEMFKGKTKDEGVNLILDRYENPPHLVNSTTLNVHSRGILFRWSGDSLHAIEIFEPWNYY